MSRKFITIVLSAAIAVTAVGHTPARADEDFARAVATLVGVAIVGAAIRDRINAPDQRKTSGKKNQSSKKKNNNRQKNITPAPHLVPYDEWANRRLRPDKATRRLLPGNCLRSYEVGDERYRFFAQKCLEDSYDFSRSLPQDCEIRFRAGDRLRSGYDARCLRRAGYQLARG